jgi:16S rRNA (guanine527-N7)-methyltransferase
VIGGSKEQALRLLHVSRETRARLEVYEALLLKWQSVKNLVAPTTLGDVWMRHFVDSLQVLALAPRARRWADIGAGAGFPGLVIGIALADTPDAIVHLIESDNRKCAFLRDVIRETGAKARVEHGRAEAIIPKLKEIDVVTARAVAPLHKLVEIAAPLMNIGATALFPKGRDYRAELTRLSPPSNFDIETKPSLTDKDAVIVVMRRIHPPVTASQP